MSKLLITLLLLTFSFSSFARCFEYIFAGGELNPTDGEFLTIRGDYVKKYAQRIGCKTLFFKDKSKSSMERELNEFISVNNFSPSRDKLHISIISHGAASGVKINRGGLISYDDFLSVVDNSLPAGSKVTFTGQSCRPRFNTALHSKRFQNIESICGVTASSGAKKAIIFRSAADSARAMEFVPTGMKFWFENKHHASISNFYYQGAASSIYHLARGARATSMWFAKTELSKRGFTKTQRVPLLNFLDGTDSFAKRNITLSFPKRPLQLLQIGNDQVQKPSYSRYVNMYELFFDIAQLNPRRLLNQIQNRYPTSGSKIVNTYNSALEYLLKKETWDAFTYNLRYLHEQRLLKGAAVYPECDFVNSHSSCSRSTLQAASRIKNYLAVLKQLDDVYITLQLWKDAPEKFDQFIKYYECESEVAI